MIALARQPGNKVSISYRREVFVRLKEKNEKNITQLVQNGKVRAFMGSNISEIHREKVRLEAADKSSKELGNDFVFIFAGGDPPTELPKKAGIQFRTS